MAVKLKKREQTLTKVPERYRPLYNGDDDKGYTLDMDGEDFGIEGFVPSTRLAEFRDQNTELQNQLKQFQGATMLTPEQVTEYTGLKARAKDLEDSKLIAAGKVEEVVGTRTETMRREHDAALTALRTENAALAGKAKKLGGELSGLKVKSAAIDALVKLGKPRQSALSDIMNRARSVWNVDDDGKLKALNPETGKPLFNGDGLDYTMDDWAKTVVTEAPHLFEDSNGGGAGGSSSLPAGGSAGGATISRVDYAKGRNLEEVAAGKVRVSQP